MKKIFSTLFVAFSLSTSAAAQQSSGEPGIQDNSFLIEEAYNQSPGDVQHINVYTRSLDGNGWSYSFTQEWPAWSTKHQLSYSVGSQEVDAQTGRQTGLADTALHYRYQLLGDGDSTLAVAPRFTLLLPTGDSRRGLGTGAVGLQENLPVSLVLPKHFVTHFNAGVTTWRGAKDEQGEREDITAFNLGHSLVWLAHPRFNVLLETVWTGSKATFRRGPQDHDDSLFVSPGVRWSYNFASGLQIVPGVGVPVGVGPSHGEHAIIFYLSFEHPFSKHR